jgi:CheY-like chemotaxis protein
MSSATPDQWLLAAEAASSLSEPGPPRNGGMRMPGRDASVLVVEDDAELGSLLTLLTAAVGFRMHATRDEAEGLRLFRQWLPDAVITDGDNTALDGLALPARIRREEPGSPMPIVILTSGYAEDDGEGVRGRAPVFAVDKDAGVAGLFQALMHRIPMEDPAAVPRRWPRW